MDRFSSESYLGAPAHFRSEEDYLDWKANNQPEPEEIEEEEAEEPEPVPAVMLSACCAGDLRYERYDFGMDPETGWKDEGERVTCATCGNETDPELQPVFSVRLPSGKPVEKQQAELPVNQGVA